MANVGNGQWDAAYDALPGTATGEVVAVPWVAVSLGSNFQTQPYYEDGLGIDGGGTTTPGVTMPTQGQMWPTGIFNPKATPMERVTATLTTASLAADASESGTVTLSDGYRLLRVTTSRPARVRLYTTTAKRDADASRALGTDPTGDHGLVLDFVSTASVLAADLSPTVDGFDGATTPTGLIPYHVTNKDTVTGTVVVTFNWIVTEA